MVTYSDNCLVDGMVGKKAGKMDVLTEILKVIN